MPQPRVEPAFSEYKSEALLLEPPYSILSVSFCGSVLAYVYFAYFNFPMYVSRKTESASFDDLLTGEHVIFGYCRII